MKIRTLSSSPRQIALNMALVAVLFGLTGTTAHADENGSAAAAALKILIAPTSTGPGSAQSLAELLPGQATAGAVASPSTRTTTQVQRGEGLDAVVRRTLPGLPLKEDFLRRAFMRVNPQMYPTPVLRPLKPGTTLYVPGMDDLQRMLKEQGPLAAALLQTQSSPDDAESAPTSKGPDKRRWVRFP